MVINGSLNWLLWQGRMLRTDKIRLEEVRQFLLHSFEHCTYLVTTRGGEYIRAGIPGKIAISESHLLDFKDPQGWPPDELTWLDGSINP